MHAIAISTNEACLENYLDAFRLISAQGGRFTLVCWQIGGASVPAAALALAESERRIVTVDGAASQASRLPEIARWIVAQDPDVLFLCETESSVAKTLGYLMYELKFRGIVVGGQSQLSPVRSPELGASRLLCFGAQQLRRMHPQHQMSAYAVGLPRLDRLKDLPVSRSGYILFLAHGELDAPVVNAALSAYERHTRRPVVLCDEEGGTGRYGFRSSLPVPAVAAVTGRNRLQHLIQHCDMVLGTDSIRLLDALYLGKPVVLLPNAGLGGLDHYPGIAAGFAPAAIEAALRRLDRERDALALFLEDVVGGMRHDHAERVCTALARLVVSGPLRPVEQSGEGDAGVPPDDAPLPKIGTRVELLSFVPRAGAVAELGVAKGSFSDELLRFRRDIKLYSVDRWAGDRGHDSEEYAAACRLLGRHGHRCTIVRKDFADALDDFPAESLDLVYLDGYAHNGQEGGRTIEQWWAKVRPGGIFAGHDYHPDWKPTVEAVDAFCCQHGLALQTTEADFFPSWYVRKPDAVVAPAAREHMAAAVRAGV